MAKSLLDLTIREGAFDIAYKVLIEIFSPLLGFPFKRFECLLNPVVVGTKFLATELKFIRLIVFLG